MSKYHARKCEIHTPRHDSLGECRRFCELQLLQRAGEIMDLEEKVTYELLPATRLFGRKVPALKYEADFRYWRRCADDKANFEQVVEDFKGMQTPAFRIKARLMQEQHSITVVLSQ